MTRSTPKNKDICLYLTLSCKLIHRAFTIFISLYKNLKSPWILMAASFWTTRIPRFPALLDQWTELKELVLLHKWVSSVIFWYNLHLSYTSESSTSELRTKLGNANVMSLQMSSDVRNQYRVVVYKLLIIFVPNIIIYPIIMQPNQRPLWFIYLWMGRT